ncbi:MAG: flagellar biosynthetic protein FliR [Bacillota bacterium]
MGNWQSMLLVLVRMASFMVAAPFFAIRQVPGLAKIGLAALLTFLIFPALPPVPAVLLPDTLGGTALVLVGEVLVGLAMGFVATLTFSAIRVAGELADLHMGFAMTILMDPQTSTQTSLMGEFLYLVGILLLLAANAHHHLLAGLIKSYQIVPLGSPTFSGLAASNAVGIFSAMFAMAVRIAAPVMAVMLITDLALGMVARTVPQLNVFILGFPLKIALGIFTFSLAAPLLAVAANNLFAQMEKDLALLIGSLF